MRNKRTKLALKPETIKHLGRAGLRRAKGGVRTVFESLFLPCEPGDGGPEETDNICDTAAGPCHTDFASCATNYFECNTGNMMCV